jgi:predicted ArsR family transcriptional regulator
MADHFHTSRVQNSGPMTIDVVQPQDDALAQPTRARLFALLGELHRPVATDELARRLDLHPNGIRSHLERLRDAGLVQRERTRQARGRPRDMWLIAPAAAPAGRPPTGYADLGRWLARAISPTTTNVRAAEAAGREIGREIGASPSGPPEARMHAALAALGFAPRRECDGSGSLTYRLCNCPYRDAVRYNPDVVCGMHRGITRGLIDVIDPATTLSAFVAHDPDTAGCLIELTGGIATTAEPAT